MKLDKSIKIDYISPTQRENLKTRLLVAIITVCFCFAIISYKLIDISALGGDKEIYLPSHKKPNNLVNRADIVDRNGKLIATNLISKSLYANPLMIKEPLLIAKKINQIFPELSIKQLLKKLSQEHNFVWIKRGLTPKEQYKINEIGSIGLKFQNEESRVYPHKNLFSHTLGYIDIDGNGIAGIEKYFNNYLNGLEENFEQKPLRLSLDLRVQNILRDELLQQINKFKALGGSGIIMDVNNGEILAMTSLPDFDPNNLNNVSDNKKFNRATFGVYEMGSTFKTLNTAIALEEKTASLKTMYDISKPLHIAKFTINDFHPIKEKTSMQEIFIRSSNIGSAKIAAEIGANKQRKFFEKIGMLDQLNIELVEKSLALYPDNWGKISAMTISYGHGIAVTPMHLVQATASMINGGENISATLIADKKNLMQERIITKHTSDKIRKLMRFAVKYGTGSNADIKGYMVGGKTGSADKAQIGGYSHDAMISSFIAAFPMQSPKYIVFIMLDEPESKGYLRATGGIAAAPVVGRIIEKIAPILGVAPVDENEYKIRREFWYDERQHVAIATRQNP